MENADEQKKYATQVILTDALIRKLDAEAQRRTMSRSLIIRLACEKWLAQLAEKDAQTL